MSKKESCPSVGAPGQQMALDSFSEAIHTDKDNSTGKCLISSFLLHGQRNAICISQLETWTGLDSRIIRKQIEQERRGGCPILSDNHSGYYLPETEQEKAMCVRSLRHRAMEILRTAGCIDRAEMMGE